MIVELSLFGFGDDRPPSFGNRDRITLTLDEYTTVSAALNKSGFTGTKHLTAMLNNTVVPHQDWNATTLSDGDALKVLSAIEGG